MALENKDSSIPMPANLLLPPPSPVQIPSPVDDVMNGFDTEEQMGIALSSPTDEHSMEAQDEYPGDMVSDAIVANTQQNP